MSISTEKLETLCGKLQDLDNFLRVDARAPATALEQTDRLVVASQACDVMLPSPLTLAALSLTIQKKIETVGVLLERARLHQLLPADAQAAAEEENMFMEEDYCNAPELQESKGSNNGNGSETREGGTGIGSEGFSAMLAAEGFDKVVYVERAANSALDDHSHPFEAKALVTHGEMHIRTIDGERLYQTGDIFHLQAGCPHSERYGAVGVVYLVGRKSPESA